MQSTYRIIALTALAMIAFAANSLLAREALISGTIGPWSFALIRVVAGAVVLALIAGWGRTRLSGSWGGAVSLLGYAAFFAYAYLALDAGTGALILFAMVQITMIGAGLIQGERPGVLQWLGIVAAIGGLIALVAPGLSAPDPLGAAAMTIAGIAWGAYSLIGRGGADPTAQTAGNFVRAALIAGVLTAPVFVFAGEARPGAYGIALAVISGGVTSGIGYAIWYAALKGLSATRAGIAQLTVPPLAALGGIAFLGEAMTGRFIGASVVILLGVGLVIIGKNKAA